MFTLDFSFIEYLLSLVILDTLKMAGKNVFFKYLSLTVLLCNIININIYFIKRRIIQENCTLSKFIRTGLYRKNSRIPRFFS